MLSRVTSEMLFFETQCILNVLITGVSTRNCSEIDGSVFTSCIFLLMIGQVSRHWRQRCLQKFVINKLIFHKAEISFQKIFINRWRSGSLAEHQPCIQDMKASTTTWAPLHSNIGQVIHTYEPLTPSSTIWYRPNGGAIIWPLRSKIWPSFSASVVWFQNEATCLKIQPIVGSFNNWPMSSPNLVNSKKRGYKMPPPPEKWGPGKFGKSSTRPWIVRFC